MSLLTGLLAYYKYDENTGTLVADATGNSHDGTWHGTGTHWTPGVVNSGGLFNGSDDYVQFPFSSGFDEDFTIAQWVDIDTLEPTATLAMLLSDTYGNYWFVMNQLWDGSEYRFRVALYDNSNNPYCDSITIPVTNQRYLVGLTRDTSQGKIFLYVNGVQENSAIDTTTSVPPYSKLYMGIDVGRTGNDKYKGMLDAVPIYNRVLSDDEWTQLYNGGLGIQYPFILTTNQAQSGKARIQVTTNQVQAGKARTTVTATKTQLGKSRIQAITAKILTGKARVTGMSTQIQLAKTRVTATATQQQSGKADIRKTTSQAQQGKAGITNLITTQTQTGKANIISAFDLYANRREVAYRRGNLFTPKSSEDYHV